MQTPGTLLRRRVTGSAYSSRPTSHWSSSEVDTTRQAVVELNQKVAADGSKPEPPKFHPVPSSPDPVVAPAPG